MQAERRLFDPGQVHHFGSIAQSEERQPVTLEVASSKLAGTAKNKQVPTERIGLSWAKTSHRLLGRITEALTPLVRGLS